MKVRKKVLATLLAAVTMLSMGVTAFATQLTPTEAKDITLIKEYAAPNGGSSPEETFAFTVEKVSVSDSAITEASQIPEVTVDSVSYSAGEAGTDNSKENIVVHLPQYTGVGVYTYKITETSSNTAGVSYDGSSVYLKVTVSMKNGKLVCDYAVRKGSGSGDKFDNESSDAFTNTYEAGTLKITKNVTGNMGDQSQYFEFKVTLNAPAGKDVSNVAIGVGETSYSANPDSIELGTEATFYLHHGETLNLTNIPYGVTYAVVETQADGYEVPVYAFTDESKRIDSAEDTVTVTNHKESEIDTGITLDTLPYILVFGLVMIAAVVMIMRKYRVED